MPPSPPGNRAELRLHFVKSGDWSHADFSALAGDASRRRYFRLTDRKTDKTAILMDAPYEAGEDVRPFVSVAQYLRGAGLSAPEIFDMDLENGFLILEDFGFDLFDQVCLKSPKQEPDLYDAAVDVLVSLAYTAPMDGLTDYTSQMTDLAVSCLTWYAEPIMQRDLSEARANLTQCMQPFIDLLGPGQVTSLRDFHAQNLLWLPKRNGPARVGLLDFQDAMRGPVAYDLISLTTDARRDVAPSLQARCLKRFADRMSYDYDRLKREAAICSVQRNLRILMVFARMSLHFEKPHYVDLIPRVWDYLQADLAHPDLAPLAKTLNTVLPEPTPDALKGLKDKCGTVSTLL